MGQTLTHGVYLPDEGERNCYSGLAANWQLLDGAVGTVAEHTSALAGKAPAVHTHTKSQITDFPAYGTTAGTICEGNDSRLSDARTPVAHTHTKSDVTDLLNSNFIPSANNSYNLGSSSYQWNNLYAKNYYYNGVAWGLDKANVWTGINIFKQNITYERTNFYHQTVSPCYILKDTELEKGSLASTHSTAYPGLWHDKNNNILGYVRFVEYSSGRQAAEFRLSNLIKNGALDPTGSEVSCTALLELQPSGEKSLIPEQNKDINLGTSTNKWKTLNGINPGALSLPTTDSTKWVDLLGSLTAASSANTYTPAVDGWISVMLKKTGDAVAVFLIQGNIKASCFSNTALVGERAFAASACIPVRAGISVDIHLKGSGATIDSAYFMPCQGNV